MKLLDAIVKRTNGCAMFEFRNNGKVYWLFNHHTKLNPHKDALRVNLGKCIRPRHKYVHMNGDYLYLTHTLQETIARNEASEKLNRKIKPVKRKEPPIKGTSWDSQLKLFEDGRARKQKTKGLEKDAGHKRSHAGQLPKKKSKAGKAQRPLKFKAKRK